jgi:hypothetical protein
MSSLLVNGEKLKIQEKMLIPSTIFNNYLIFKYTSSRERRCNNIFKTSIAQKIPCK